MMSKPCMAQLFPCHLILDMPFIDEMLPILSFVRQRESKQRQTITWRNFLHQRTNIDIFTSCAVGSIVVAVT